MTEANYTPILFPPTVSKIGEKYLAHWLSRLLEDHQLLDIIQMEFRPGLVKERALIRALMAFVNEVIWNLAEKIVDHFIWI